MGEKKSQDNTETMSQVMKQWRAGVDGWNTMLVPVFIVGLCVALGSGAWLRSLPFDDQVSRVIANVTMSQERLRSLPRVLRHIESTMNTVWSGSKAEMFGSAAFELAFTTSDVDISLVLPDAAYADTDLLQKANDALQKEPQVYRNIKVTTSTRLPVITLHFAPEKINCDIVLTKNIGPAESKLIKYLLHADERGLKLAVLLKLWGKLNGITGNSHVTNYNVVLLVIFYLQERLILPPVVELQENVAPEIVDGMDYSNIAFERKILTKRNDESLYELLGGFFEFYDVFDFGKYIVCPFTGRPVEKKLFRNLDDVPDVFSLYKFSVGSNKVNPLNVSTVMCIQDPLIHSNSCSRRVDGATLRELKNKFKTATILYRKCKRDDFLSSILWGSGCDNIISNS